MSSSHNLPVNAGLSSDSAQQRALVRWMAELTHQGLVATDTALRVVVWNRWMEIHSGQSADAVIGRSLLDLYPDLTSRGIEEHYRGALEGRITVLSHGLHRFLLPLSPTRQDLPGEYMPQSGRITPLSDGAMVIGTVTLIEDVSSHVGAEAELRRQIEAQREARATAERALRAKDEFLSTLSHEMRSPLNAILGWARILLGRRSLDPDVLTRAVEVIERNAATQARMIDDMLDIARVSAGKLRLEMQPVDLVSIVLAAMDVVGPSAAARRITLRTRLDPAAPRVLGDPDRCQQIVWNLLSNAVKFTDAGGEIRVRLEFHDPMVHVVVQDTGQGISSAFLPFVFERFRQHDASSARRHGGLGLGLALVRELVQLHGGRVSADSAGEGRGATFTVELPAEVSAAAGREDEGPGARMADEPVSLAGVRVLVVEDEMDARDVAVSALEYCGAEVIAVGSSAAALEALLAMSSDSLPHAIVSDIGMPQEDGYHLIRRVRALAPEQGGCVPAIAVTGYATPDDVDQAIRSGYHMHVSKPIDPKALTAILADIIAAERPTQPTMEGRAQATSEGPTRQGPDHG